MNDHLSPIHVIGGGLAGSEAAADDVDGGEVVVHARLLAAPDDPG